MADARFKDDKFDDKGDAVHFIAAVDLATRKVFPIPYDEGSNTIRTSAGSTTLGDLVIRDSIDGTRKAEVTAARELSVLVANPTTNPETGLAKETTLQTIATESTLASVEAAVDQLETKLDTLLTELQEKTEPAQNQRVDIQRPSEKTGRTHVNFSTDGILTASTTVYTVTAGKTLYLTSLIISGRNNSLSNRGRLQVTDNAAVPPKLELGSRSGTGDIFEDIIMSFPEPLQFTTNVRMLEAEGNLEFTVSGVGYEE